MRFYDPSVSSLFSIERVEITTRGRSGRQEFTDSLKLFRHLSDLGRRQITVTRIAIDGQRRSVRPLNTFLGLHRSLQPFWRMSKIHAYGTKYQWSEFCALMEWS